MKKDLIVVGTGPAGITAGMLASEADWIHWCLIRGYAADYQMSWKKLKG